MKRDERRRTSRPRSGVSTLVSVLGLLGVLGLAGVFQYTLSRRAVGEVQRIQLSALARMQARSAIQELLAQVGRQVNTPDTPLFRDLRMMMDEIAPEYDLTDALRAPAIDLEPGWGKRSASGASGRASARVVSHRALIRGRRSSRDIQGSEEWAGVLTLTVVAEVADSASTVRREVSENYEIRTLLIAPPRPFDQLGLYLGRHDTVLDARRINATRQRLLAEQRELFEEVQKTHLPSLSAEQQERLAQIAQGMLPPDEVAARTPEVPKVPSALWGFYHTGRYALKGLDLVSDLEEIQADIARWEGQVRTSKGSPEKLLEGIYHLVDGHSNAVNLIWDYQRVMNLRPRDGKVFQESVAPYLPRLTPDYFLDRANLEIHPEDPVFRRWTTGASKLEGILDLTRYGSRITLRGELLGRVMILVGEHGVDIEDLNKENSTLGHRVVLVSMGGDVEVRGTSHASVIMLGPKGQPEGRVGRIRIPSSAQLNGNLIVPEPTPGSLELEGAIHYDASLMVPYPPRETLQKPFAGEYVVALSPTPLFSEGRAR